MTETTTLAAVDSDEEYVAIPVSEADRQRFRPIDATAERTRSGLADASSRTMLVAIVAVTALLVAFAAGYGIGDSGRGSGAPVQDLAQVGSAPVGGSDGTAGGDGARRGGGMRDGGMQGGVSAAG